MGRPRKAQESPSEGELGIPLSRRQGDELKYPEKPPLYRGRLRIARAILGLGKTATEARRLRKCPWKATRACVQVSYMAGAAPYRSRLARCVETATSAGSNMIVFPAYSLVMTNNRSLGFYRELLEPFEFAWAGALDLRPSRPSPWVLAFRYGQLVERKVPGEVAIYEAARTNIVAAVSTSIKGARTGLVDRALSRGKRVVPMLDAAHHSYAGYRPIRLFSNTAEQLASRVSRGTILPIAYWRYAGSRGDYPWVFASEGVAWRSARVELGDHGFNDSIDVIEVSTM